MKDSDVFRIGTLGKPHGVKGELTFQFDDDIFDRTDTGYVFVKIDGLLVPFFFDAYRFRTDETALVTFSDIDTEEKAAELSGCDVYFPRSVAAEAGDDEAVSVAELVGFSVFDDNDDEFIGTIEGIDDSTANVLFQVKTEEGKELLIPVSDDLITDIDRESESITMTIPEGLLSL